MLFLSLAPSVSLAEDRIGEISELVAASFRAQQHHQIDHLKIQEINRWERNHDILSVSAEDHLVIKYMLSHWRMWTQNYLLSQTERGPRFFYDAINRLSPLNYVLDQKSIGTLHDSFTRLEPRERQDPELRRTYAKLIATHGDPRYAWHFLDALGVDEAFEIAGPRAQHTMVPMLPHPIAGTSRWVRENMALSYYKQAEGGAIEYRGVIIRPGDILLVDLNEIFDGINTSIGTPRSSFTHSAVVVFLDHNGKNIPAALEIHSAGMRVVPLNRYLSPRFTSYIEVFRLEDSSRLPKDWQTTLNALTKRVLVEQMGYDFNAQDIPLEGYRLMFEKGQSCVMCSNMVDMVYKTMGVDLNIPRTQLAEGALPNVERLGLEGLASRGEYLSPTDIKMTEGLSRAGVIDNGFTRNVIRELVIGGPEVEGSVGHYMSHNALDASRMDPFWRRGLYRSVRWLARSVQNRTRTGRSLEFGLNHLTGMNRRTMPQAPPDVIATVVSLNNAIELAAKDVVNGFPASFPSIGKTRGRNNCHEVVSTLSVAEPFNIRVIENQQDVRHTIHRALIRQHFPSAFR